jgi:hypothetical protein
MSDSRRAGGSGRKQSVLKALGQARAIRDLTKGIIGDAVRRRK